jgi:hypothetical protein
MTDESQSEREWPVAVVLSLASSRLLCSFSDMHTFAEWFIGEPVYTHQFAHRPFLEDMREAIYAQYPVLRTFDATAVSTESWRENLREAEKQYGRTLAMRPMAKPPTTAADSFKEPLRGKRVVAVVGDAEY